MPLIGEGGGGRGGAWGWGRNQAAAPVPCSATIFWVLAVVLVSPVPRDGWQWQQSLQCKLRWSEVSSTGGALGTWGALCRGLSPLPAPKLCWEWGNMLVGGRQPCCPYAHPMGCRRLSPSCPSPGEGDSGGGPRSGPFLVLGAGMGVAELCWCFPPSCRVGWLEGGGRWGARIWSCVYDGSVYPQGWGGVPQTPNVPWTDTGG